jgi:hypothetical protein
MGKSCDVCTFFNHGEAELCEMCLAPLPQAKKARYALPPCRHGLMCWDIWDDLHCAQFQHPEIPALLGTAADHGQEFRIRTINCDGLRRMLRLMEEEMPEGLRVDRKALVRDDPVLEGIIREQQEQQQKLDENQTDYEKYADIESSMLCDVYLDRLNDSVLLLCMQGKI